MTQALQDLTAKMLTAAKSAGADAADAMALEDTSLNIDVREGKLEQAERAESIDIGLRVFVGQRSALVSASDTKNSTIETMAERAIAMAREAPEDPHSGIADASQLATDWDVDALELYDPTDEPDPKALQEDAYRAEAAALAIKGITQVQSSSAAYGKLSMHLATSNGFNGGFMRTDRNLSCVAF